MPTRNAHHCPRCGYNLSGLDPETICPECMLPGPAVRSVIPLAAAEPAHLRTLALAITLWGVAAVIDAVGSIVLEIYSWITSDIDPWLIQAYDVWQWSWVGLLITSVGAAVLLCSATRGGRVGHHRGLGRLLLVAAVVYALPHVWTYVDMFFFGFQFAIGMSSTWQSVHTLLYVLAIAFPFLMVLSLAHVGRIATSPRREKLLKLCAVLVLLFELPYACLNFLLAVIGLVPPVYMSMFDWVAPVQSVVELVIGILSLLLAHRIRRVVIPEAIRLRETPPVPPE